MVLNTRKKFTFERESNLIVVTANEKRCVECILGWKLCVKYSVSSMKNLR